MRAPELQLIDKLEEVKNSIEQPSLNTGDLSPILYKKNLLSALASQAAGTGSKSSESNEGIALLKEVMSLTEQFIDKLIENKAGGKRVSERELESLLNDILSDNPKKEELSQLVFMTLVGIVQDYYKSVEKICVQYGLTLPQAQSSAHTAISEDASDSDSDSDEMNAAFSLSRLKEAKYFINMMLNQSLEELSALHPLKDMPFLRTIQLSDAVVAEIEKSQSSLHTNLVLAIENAQKKLREVMSAKHYPMTLNTPADYVAQQSQLLLEIEVAVNGLEALRSLWQVSGTAGARIVNPSIGELFLAIARLFELKKSEFAEGNIAQMRVEHAVIGTDVERMSRSATSNGLSLQALGLCSYEDSRFGIIERILSKLLSELNHYQVAAFASTSDFDLKDYVRKLRSEFNPMEINCDSMRNMGKMLSLNERYTTAVTAFVARMQGRSPQAQENVSQAARSSAPSLFFTPRPPQNAARSSNTVEPQEPSSDEKSFSNKPQ